MRKPTRQVFVGSVGIGADNPVSVQSMTNVDTKDLAALKQQMDALSAAGCDLIRIALYDRECADLVPDILRAAPVPIIGDVHFDHEIAVRAIENGIHKVRINPGNIGDSAKVSRVAHAARAHGVPLRVGANTGSLPKTGHGLPVRSAESLANAALREVRVLESLGFEDIVVSIKSSDVPESVQAARLISQECGYPLHLGITEAGTGEHALIKSAVGIGTLLMEGIGDTIRVSVSGDPVREVHAAHEILCACGMETPKVNIVSCPTCARTGIDVETLAKQVEEAAQSIAPPGITIAVMGCAVNGPGEARHADIGLAGCPEGAVLFAKGKVVRTVPKEEALDALLDALRKMR